MPDVATLIYPKLTALDAVGPYEVLGQVPGWDVRFVAPAAGPQTTDQGTLALVADRSIDEVDRADVLLVPGGEGNRPLLSDERVLDWVRRIHETTRWTTSVCTGALVLAAAGVLDGVEATTHWAFRDELERLGASPVAERVVQRGKVVTAAGVSSGIDMALRLVQLEVGDDMARAVQLGIEYDPDPPFDAGSPDRLPEPLVAAVRRAVGAG